MAENENHLGQSPCSRPPIFTLQPSSGEWGLTSMMGLRNLGDGQDERLPSSKGDKKQSCEPNLTLHSPSGEWTPTSSIRRGR